MKNTAPHLAAYEGRSDVIEILFQRKADIDKQNNRGRTPLACAAVKGHSGATQLLLNHGADPQIPDIDGDKPLTLALKKNHSAATVWALLPADFQAAMLQ